MNRKRDQNSNNSSDEWNHLWVDVHIATMESSLGLKTPDIKDSTSTPTASIENGAIAIAGDTIAWIGEQADLPPFDKVKTVVHQGQGRWITPGLIDCHTHLVFSGDRSAEHQQRQQGVSYETIAGQGGGINSTVTATRAASAEQLYKEAKRRVLGFFREGVTTIEIKSGYGLDTKNEIKILQVAKQLAENLPLSIVPTFLGAHTVPLEYKGRADDYIDLVCNEMIPEVASLELATSVDVFCENIAFNLSQSEKVFEAAKRHGLAVKMHGDQLSNGGASPLAAHHHALSVDHLEFAEESDVIALKNNNVVAVLLPGAFYFLKETQKPPIPLLRQHTVPIALGSDCNPGSSPIYSLLTILNLASVQFDLTVDEVLAGVTINAAMALGLEDSLGSLRVGKKADFVLWDVEHLAELVFKVGVNPCDMVIKNGELYSRQELSDL